MKSVINWRYPARNAALRSAVGEKVGDVIRVRAHRGCALNGPYLDLPAGRCAVRVLLRGRSHGRVRMELTVKDGREVLASESFDLLKGWIRSCHINELEKDASGAYPYRELFTLLKGIGYDRYTLCEVGKTPPSVEAGVEFLKNYKALWTKLANG